MPGGVSLLLDTLEFVLLALGMAGLFHHVPNTWVRWRHALAGGLFVAVAFETAKGALAWYLKERILPPLYWDGMLKGREWLAQPEMVG